MNLIATAYVLTLISSAGAEPLGNAPSALHCAAALGYTTYFVETEGGETVSTLLVQEDGTFSTNIMYLGEVITLVCAPK